jgi:hypothetical protein
METQKSNDNKGKTAGTVFGCNPEDFKKMFRTMDSCCSAQKGMPDCSTMMKTMMETCCGPKTDESKTDRRKEKQGSDEQEI